jgi:aminomethyltransferase
MGEFRVIGPGAAAFLNHTLTNDLHRLAIGQGQYTLMCHEHGGVVDDLYGYRLDKDDYLLIVNASRIGADWDWLQGQVDLCRAPDGFALRDESDATAAIAVQGPRVAEFINDTVAGGSIGGAMVPHVTELKKNQVGSFVFHGVPLYVARTGYTGEDGFELMLPATLAEAVWNRLLISGRAAGLKPAGLGARDTLRTEMGFPLYGHELDEETTPLEAGLGHFVALDKGEFVGRAALAAQKAGGVRRRCVAFRMTEKTAPPRPHYAIWSTGAPAAVLGEVVSGTQSPTLGVGIGMGYVPPGFAVPGTGLAIEIRGRRVPAVVVAKPIYRRAAPATEPKAS